MWNVQIHEESTSRSIGNDIQQPLAMNGIASIANLPVVPIFAGIIGPEEPIEEGGINIPISEIQVIDMNLKTTGYAAVPRTTAVRHLRCKCTEQLTNAIVHVASQRMRIQPKDCDGSQEANAHASEPAPRLRCGPLQGILRIPSVPAKYIANKIIRYARCTKTSYEELCCYTCGKLPFSPRTGDCGHTRCGRCVGRKSICPCGKDLVTANFDLHINITVRELVTKICGKVIETEQIASSNSGLVPADSDSARSPRARARAERRARPYNTRPWNYSKGVVPRSIGSYASHLPMSDWARLNLALQLLNSGFYMDAAPHLALVAVSNSAVVDVMLARSLLAQTITILLSDEHNARSHNITRTINRSIRALSPCLTEILKPEDMECVVCFDTYDMPMTTPCGHTFCRVCLEKVMKNHRVCPLCKKSLKTMILPKIRETAFVQAALMAINALRPPIPFEDEGLTPIIICTVAFPAVCCPLCIIKPEYITMIRRVLDGSRRFGMVAVVGDTCSSFGTLLEVRDCVQLENGQYLMSTVGVSRFKIMEKNVRYGCEVAAVLPLQDRIPVTEEHKKCLKSLAHTLKCSALSWLNRQQPDVLRDIEEGFGTFPHKEGHFWWTTADGPAWLWWLVAVLPLREEIKLMILMTDSLHKRMLVVLHTLHLLKQVTKGTRGMSVTVGIQTDANVA